MQSDGLPLELCKLLSAYDDDFLVTQFYGLPSIFCVNPLLNAFVTIVYLQTNYVFSWVFHNLGF